MAVIVYGLCAVAAFLCAFLLLKAYYASRYKMLLWGGLCFAGLTLNNILVAVDKIYVPQVDLTTWRLITALMAMLVLLYGLIFDTE